MNPKRLAVAFDNLVERSLERTLIIGRLGLPDGTIDVPGRTGYVYVSKGDSGELGHATAIDRVGVASVANQKVWMRREHNQLIVYDAEQYAGTTTYDTLSGLTDVELTSLADGEGLVWDSGTSKWINATLSGGAGAPSPHARDSAHHTGLEAWSNIDLSTSDLADLATRSHADLTNVTANQHHNQIHDITGGDHTITGSAFDVVGATGTNTLGVLTPSSSPGAAAAILRTDANGSLTLDTSLLVVNANTNVVTIDTTLFKADAATDVVTFDGTLLDIDAANDEITIDTNLVVINAVSNNIAIDTNLLVINAGDNTITVDTNLFVIDADDNTISLDNGVLLFDANANTLVTSAASTFNGAVVLNSNGTFNTGVFTFNTDPQISANLDFIGGDRSITASNNLTISPTTDLILDPTGLIVLPNAQEMRTSTFSDLVTGINGFRMWDRGSNYRQLTTGAGKFDELYVRVFVADGVRIDMGEEYWSKSYGIVEEDFTLPADEATVDVWFEDVPGLGVFPIFSVGDWLLCRTIDWDTGLTVQKVWFQVVDGDGAGTNNWIQSDTTNYRQQWRLRRKNGGTTGQVIKKGNVMVDTGQEGQGWIHLSALEQDGGPFIQIGEMTDDSGAEPAFTNYVRMGNLNGTVDYSADTWGFAAGDNLGTTPSTGFSGLAADATNGLRLFNVEFLLYDGSTKMVQINEATGMTLDFDIAEDATWGRYIRWQDDLNSFDATSSASVGGWKDGSDNVLLLRSTGTAGTDPRIHLRVEDNSINGEVELYRESFRVDVFGTYLRVGEDDLGNGAGRVLVSSSGSISTASTLHVYENTTQTGAAAGVTIEQDGTGDAVAQFLLTGGQRWVAGIDNSDSDKFKIAPGADVGSSTALAIDTSGVTTLSALTVSGAATLSSTLAVSGASSLTGNATVGNGTGSPAIVLNGAAGGSKNLNFQSNGTARWVLFSDTTAESGSNAGSNMILRSFTDAGSTLRDNITITRSTGKVTFPGDFETGGSTASTRGDLQVDAANKMTYVGRLSGTSGDSSGFALRDRLGGEYFVYNPNTYGSVMAIAVPGGASAGIGTTSPASKLHVYENTSNTGVSVGLTIEQDGTGDALLQFLNTGEQRFVMGIDRSDGWKFKIAPNADVHSNTLFTMTTTGLVGIKEDNPTAYLDIASSDANILRPTVYGGTAWYHLVTRRAAGTQAAPTQVGSSTIIGSWGAMGYTSSGWAAGVSAEIRAEATEAPTSTARGSKWAFNVTANGTTTLTTALELGNDLKVTAIGVYNHTAAVSANVVIGSGGLLQRATSSIRYKTDVRPLESPDLLDRLTPVLYKPAEGVGGGDRDFVGLIAEDVVAVGGDDFVVFGDDGQPENVMYDRLVVLTIGELQTLKRRVAELEARLN